MVSALPQLTKLDFFNQFLTGTLPSNISFPRLMEIRLINNDISVGPCVPLLLCCLMATPNHRACQLCCDGACLQGFTDPDSSRRI